MAFTHDQPRDRRHTVEAFEPSTTDYVTTNFVSASSESSTGEILLTSSSRTEESQKSFSPAGSTFERFMAIKKAVRADSTTDQSTTQRTDIGFTSESESYKDKDNNGETTRTTVYTANWASSVSSEGGSGTRSGVAQGHYNDNTDEPTSKSSFTRTARSHGTSSTVRVGDKVTTPGAKHTTEFGASSYFTFTRAKSVTDPDAEGTEYAQSTDEAGNLNRFDGDSGETNDPVAIYKYQTSLTDTTQQIVTITTKTSNTFSTYTQLDPDDLLSTLTQSFEFKTSVFDTSRATYTVTKETYESEYLPITGYFGTTYNKSSLYGGAVFITGGDTLSNGVVLNAETTTSLFSTESQPTDFNEEVKELYKGKGGNLETTITFFDETLGKTFTNVGSTDTIFTTTDKLSAGTFDFGGIVDNTIVEFTTSELETPYRDTTEEDGLFILTTKNFTYNDMTSVQFSGFSTVIVTDLQKSYFGSDGFTTEGFFSTIKSETTYSELVGFGDQEEEQGLKGGSTNAYVKPMSPDVSRTGAGSAAFPLIRVITNDKGSQGGIQNERTDVISDAVRSYRPISIADEVATTGTYTTPAASINITANSAKSDSYTFSGGLPLGLNISLNRYLTYLPNGDYGNIYSSINSSDYQFSLDGDESIIHFSSTGKYSTQSGNSSTTQSFSTILRGKVKVELGAQYTEGKQTKAYLKPMGNNSIVGGQSFTDDSGTILDLFGRSPPLSFYIFGSDDSSYISQSSTDIGTSNTFNTITVTKNSVLFFKMSSFVQCSHSARPHLLRYIP